MNLRIIEIGRAGWGAAMLCAPRVILEHIHHVEIDTKSVVVSRILGARHLGQAALSGINPSPEVLAMGVWVDAVHAGSAVALAVLDRSRARAGFTDAAIAAGWAAAGYRDLRNAIATPPTHQRRRDRLARWVLQIVPGGAQLGQIAANTRPRRD